MGNLEVRRARLDDTEAISALFRSKIEVWQRLNAQGQVENLPYTSLTIYERWLHGGAWMSLETAAIFLSRLLHGAGLALVTESEGKILAYAEAYPGLEPAPYGAHIHLTELIGEEDARHALMQKLLELARSTDHLTVSMSGANDVKAAFFARYHPQVLTQVQRYMLPARTGQSFYKVSEHLNTDADQINDWSMSVGRTESARQHWEEVWTRTWDILPEIRGRQTHRLHINAGGHEAFLCCQQMFYNQRSATLYCWSPKPLTSQLLVAIRDWTHKQNYRTLALIVPPEIVKLLGNEAEADPFTRQIYTIKP